MLHPHAPYGRGPGSYCGSFPARRGEHQRGPFRIRHEWPVSLRVVPLTIRATSRAVWGANRFDSDRGAPAFAANEELSIGIVHMIDARKLARAPFPFPYAQMAWVMLAFFTTIPVPLICASSMPAMKACDGRAGVESAPSL